MTNPASNFAVNLYAYTFKWTAADAMRHLAGKGFAGFELMMYPGHLWPSEVDAAARRDIVKVAENTKTRIVSFNMPNLDLNIAGGSEEVRTYSHDLIEGFLNLAGDVGAPKIVLGPGKANPLFPLPDEVLRGHFFRALDRLLPVAKENGVKVLIENMPFGWLPDARSLLSTVEEYGDDDVGIIYDVTNAYFISEDPCDGLRHLQHRLDLVHFSDTGRKAYRHDPVGAGDMDFSIYPPVLEEIGYSELPVLEVVSREAQIDTEILESAATLSELGFKAKAA